MGKWRSKWQGGSAQFGVPSSCKVRCCHPLIVARAIGPDLKFLQSATRGCLSATSLTTDCGQEFSVIPCPAPPHWHIPPMEVIVVATRNVVLSQHQHELVDLLVRSGRYQNASKVLREGLRLLERRESEDAARLAALRDAATKDWSDLADGRYDDITDDNLDGFIEQLGARAARAD